MEDEFKDSGRSLEIEDVTLEQLETDNLNVDGTPGAPVLVICDAPSHKVWNSGEVMSKAQMSYFGEIAVHNGFRKNSFLFVTCSPPIPDECKGSDGRTNTFLRTFQEELAGIIARCNPSILIYLGKNAGHQTMGRPVELGKVRGRIAMTDKFTFPVMPLFSPANAIIRPELKSIYESDFRQLATFAQSKWDFSNYSSEIDTNCKYRWVTDLEFLLDERPVALFGDSETRGKYGHPLCFQLCWNETEAIAVPLDCDYYKALTPKLRTKLLKQLKWLYEDPDICWAGHNFKYDLLTMWRNFGWIIANWYADTMQLAFAVDENMVDKAQSECVRRWVAEMAGYSDIFDKTYDKGHMERVPLNDMLQYGCGDVHSGFILAKRLIKLAKEDSRNWNCFERVQMPALKTFFLMERYGLKLDKQELGGLEASLAVRERELYSKLIALVPGSIKLKHKDKGLAFSRDQFLIDILFKEPYGHPDGLRLTPIVWTKGTTNLSDDQKIPSTSGKDHLPYFEDGSEFVRDLIQYKKLQKMRTTYVGKASVVEAKEVRTLKNGDLPKRLKAALETRKAAFTETGAIYINGERIDEKTLPLEGTNVCFTCSLEISECESLCMASDGKYYLRETIEPSGFWKYLDEHDFIFPSRVLHNTVTGRSASREPNDQNFPKRGALAEEFRKIFIPPFEGWNVISCDLSQAELRIAAWMANERNMLRIYAEGGDIHAATAAATLGISIREFMSFKGNKAPVPSHFRTRGFDGQTLDDFFKFKRFQAKAIGFGYLYGMGWKKFKTYAKTDYGLDYTDEEAQASREAFFHLYPGLPAWHKSMREFVRKYGYVRALHGALRRLPSIYSEDEKVQAECERQGINSPVQRFASDLGLIAMTRFSENLPWNEVRTAAFIHDAVVIFSKPERTMEAARGIQFFMQNQPLFEWFNLRCPIPIVADVSIGTNLADEKEQKGLVATAPSWYVPENN